MPNWFNGSLIVTVALLSGIALTGCSTTSQRPDVVGVNEAQRVQKVRFGTLVEFTPVRIEGDRKIGTIIGGLVGGVIGNQATRSQGDGTRTAATAAGAVAGGIAGNAAGKVLAGKKGVQLLIKMDETGDLISIVQEEDPDVTWSPGQAVMLIGDVKIRVIPRTS